ncbi:peptidoglycan-binding domain-containing protein [Calothrix sp. 336/3]|uniref:peptidoglycan-binding domain-containing protein n=1 Tax=Calothrix sp. 336/3 TaxID=1337936 RepID=UPI000624B48E|nr:peptidoglycan-binding protein [Calothrix sp. 336/3]AKG24822.1 peptidoglycan-binding protein [Calothrix sp. 336/3]
MKTPESVEIIPLDSKLFSEWNWQKLSSLVWLRFLPVAVAIATFSTAGAAFALQKGENSQQVKNVQSCLKQLGYFSGPVNGNFGSLTENAVKRFQQANRLPAIGIVGPQTQQALNRLCQRAQNPNVMQLGSRGAGVTQLQQDLGRLGFFRGPNTGYFGTETQQAVIRFQQSRGLVADGIVANGTLNAIRVSLRKSPNDGMGGDTLPNALNEGDSGSEVINLQRALRKLGYFNANPTGKFGILTKEAVARFQQANRLPVDGIADGETLQAIYQAVDAGQDNCTATRGDICLGENSQRVVAVQQRLRQWGFYNGNINGYFGAATRDAIAQFQRSSNLNPTGYVDFSTWQALRLNSNISDNPSNPNPINDDSNRENRYVVVIPMSHSQTLDMVRRYVPDAFSTTSRLGNYVNAGEFSDRTAAERRSRLLRERGFDARVDYL